METGQGNCEEELFSLSDCRALVQPEQPWGNERESVITDELVRFVLGDLALGPGERSLAGATFLKVMTSFLFTSTGQRDRFREDFGRILELGLNDSDAWVRFTASVLRDFPRTGLTTLPDVRDAPDFWASCDRLKESLSGLDHFLIPRLSPFLNSSTKRLSAIRLENRPFCVRSRTGSSIPRSTTNVQAESATKEEASQAKLEEEADRMKRRAEMKEEEQRLQERSAVQAEKAKQAFLERMRRKREGAAQRVTVKQIDAVELTKVTTVEKERQEAAQRRREMREKRKAEEEKQREERKRQKVKKHTNKEESEPAKATEEKRTELAEPKVEEGSGPVQVDNVLVDSVLATANSVSPENRDIIIDFLRGIRRFPEGHHPESDGQVVRVVLSETILETGFKETVLFEMDHEQCVWKKKRRREKV